VGHLKHSASGHLLHGPNGHLVHACEPPVNPCVSCAYTQPSAFITIAGSCSGGTWGACEEVGGNFAWRWYGPPFVLPHTCEQSCFWSWDRLGPGGAGEICLDIVYFVTPNRHSVRIRWEHADEDEILFGGCDGDEDIDCIEQILEGTIVLAGNYNVRNDCTGCTATITLNP